MRRVGLIVSIGVVGLLLASPVAVFAHGGDEDGYSWSDDPANSKVFDDCSVTYTNDISAYRLDYRLPVDVSASASRIEVVSEDAVVNYLAVAATNWGFHAEQPDAIAHAERRSPGFPPKGLLVRMGLERKDGQIGPNVSFQLKVFSTSTASPTVIDLAVSPFEGVSSGSREYLANFFCREESSAAVPVDAAAGSSTSGASEGSAPETSAPGGGFGGVSLLAAVAAGFLTILAAALLLVLRRRRL